MRMDLVSKSDLRALNESLLALDGVRHADAVFSVLRKRILMEDISKSDCLTFIRDVNMELRRLIEQEEKPRRIEMIEEAKAYIHAHACVGISLRQTAEHFFVSPTYFSHFFKEKTGINYHAYVTSVRMDRARELLKNSDWSPRDVCEMVGYTDFDYFSRLFRQETGLKPEDYRGSHTDG